MQDSRFKTHNERAYVKCPICKREDFVYNDTLAAVYHIECNGCGYRLTFAKPLKGYKD